MRLTQWIPAHYRSLVFIVLAAIVGSAVGPVTKIALTEIPPLPFTLIRFVLATCALLPFIDIKRLFPLKNPTSILLISLLATANVTLSTIGVERTTATITQMLYAGVPLLAGILSYLLLKERLSPKKSVGILVGFVGVLGIALLPALGHPSAFNGDLTGNLIILLGVGSFALYSVLSKRLQADYSPMELTMVFILTTTVAQVVLMPIDLVQHPGWWHTLSPQAIWGAVYAGTLGTGAFYLLYQHAIASATPIMASMILYLQPLFAFGWAALLLGERVTPEFLIGALLAFIGVALVTSSQQQESTKER